MVNLETSSLIDSNELTALMKPQNASGIILVDGKYLAVKGHKKGCVAIPFMDYLTHDIWVHIFADSENEIDIKRGFEMLKKLNYPLKVVVSDETMGKIAQVSQEVFEGVIHQICLTHYSKNVAKELKIKGVIRKIKSLNTVSAPSFTAV